MMQMGYAAIVLNFPVHPLLKRVLAETAAKCSGSDVPECPVLDALMA